MTDLYTEAKALQGELSRHRRWLHAHPGVAFDIADTVAASRDTITFFIILLCSNCLVFYSFNASINLIICFNQQI